MEHHFVDTAIVTGQLVDDSPARSVPDVDETIGGTGRDLGAVS